MEASFIFKSHYKSSDIPYQKYMKNKVQDNNKKYVETSADEKRHGWTIELPAPAAAAVPWGRPLRQQLPAFLFVCLFLFCVIFCLF